MKLIIVCEEKLRKYGDFLTQLISSSDDKDGEIIGVKDGTLMGQVWSEKQYEEQSIKMASEQYVLFIGNSKMIQDKRSHMIKKFSQYGMNYGWLGKQGVLFVDSVVDVDHYDEFISFAQGNQSDIKNLLEIKSDIMAMPENDGDSDDKGIKKVLNPLKGIPAAIVNAPIKGLNAMNKLANNKKIEEQEYSCLIMLFYLNGLSKFLGVDEE